MNETPYLIAHKVRGQPAFDVAIQMEMGDEVWWIIPTSGHRAYPIMHWDLSLLTQYQGTPSILDEAGPLEFHPDWDSLPDHYWQPGQTSDLHIPDNAGAGLLAALGVVRPQAMPLKRRPL